MPQPEFDADAALNRILGAITPFRAQAAAATTTDELAVVTQAGLDAGQAAIGEPLTQERMAALLFAAVLRLADVWNADASPIEIPDTPEG